ncbi:MAG: phytanoyl-CoA dioxygenase family protein [Flavobacteriales bacterium]|nr:phytanoyl-CoA dioxygenase family protein [Flavobacteriales bacterium]
MKKAIFQNTEHQKQFDKDGFIKLKLFDTETIAKLALLCSQHFPDNSEYFFSSSYLNDFELKQKISNQIIALISSRFDEYFSDYRPIGSAFLIKGKGPKSEMPMHQDWTIVDESQFYALNVWIPLIETDEKNGTLEVMKGSHKWLNSKRAPTLPFPFEGQQEKIKQHLSPINTQLGEVVVLNQALIHYSKPNLSEQIRPAITVGVVSKAATLGLYYWDKEKADGLELFEQEDNFLLKFEIFHQSIFEKPQLGKSTGLTAYAIPTVDSQEIDRYLGIAQEVQKKSFFQRIFNR